MRQVASSIHFQAIPNWWCSGDGPCSTPEPGLLMIDTDDIVMPGNQIADSPLVIAAERLDPVGFVSYVAVTACGEYRMGTISPAGMLHPTHAVAVEPAHRQAVDQYVALLIQQRQPIAGQTEITEVIPTAESGDASAAFTDPFGEVPEFANALPSPLSIPRILQN